ncbi:hypothetical protein MHU86_15574 [Fragilaria crotonensis]|nr:hypothetical protein MHU86_15574 [Fragilaria crotonensis]
MMNKGSTTCANQSSGSERARPSRRRSQTIPMPSYHVPRTNSEVQLHEDTEAAEWRDLCMFYRIVNGIRDRQALHSSHGGDNEGFRISANESFDHTSLQEPHSRWPAESVTPNDSSQEFQYAQTNMQSELPQGLQHILSNEFETRPDVNDGWSITGYDEVDPGHKIVAVVEADDVDDDGVFSMEL